MLVRIIIGVPERHDQSPNAVECAGRYPAYSVNLEPPFAQRSSKIPLANRACVPAGHGPAPLKKYNNPFWAGFTGRLQRRSRHLVDLQKPCFHWAAMLPGNRKHSGHPALLPVDERHRKTRACFGLEDTLPRCIGGRFQAPLINPLASLHVDDAATGAVLRTGLDMGTHSHYVFATLSGPLPPENYALCNVDRRYSRPSDGWQLVEWIPHSTSVRCCMAAALSVAAGMTPSLAAQVCSDNNSTCWIRIRIRCDNWDKIHA